ncbi:MAG: carboxypeptidase-like regulatory domain-containing protein [Bacteroidota bacterium]
MCLRYFIIHLFCFVCACGQAQVIKGRVLDHNGLPVPYANIGILDTQIGTASNEDGFFVLFFSIDYNEAILQVSAISHKTYSVKISDISVPTNYEITLAPHYVVLDEIKVSALDENARKIVEKALENQSYNYAQKKYQLKGFYRELLRNDETYVALTEAAFTMDDKGYHKSRDKRFRLDELRKSNDLRKMDDLDIHYDSLTEQNHLVSALRSDFIDGQNAKWSFSFWPNFNSKMLEHFEFFLDSMAFYDDQLVYCISLYSKSKSWDKKSNLVEYNRVVITRGDYAMIELHKGMKPREIKKTGSGQKGNVSYLVEGFVYSKSSIYYQKHNNRWYPHLITIHSSVVGGDRQKSSRLAFERLRQQGTDELNFDNIKYNGRLLDPDKNNYFRHRQVLITHIRDHKDGFKKIRNKELMDKDKYLHSFELPYNKYFWQNFNTILRNPYLKAAENDLTSQRSLEEQFEANGSK